MEEMGPRTSIKDPLLSLCTSFHFVKLWPKTWPHCWLNCILDHFCSLISKILVCLSPFKGHWGSFEEFGKVLMCLEFLTNKLHFVFKLSLLTT